MCNTKTSYNIIKNLMIITKQVVTFFILTTVRRGGRLLTRADTNKVN